MASNLGARLSLLSGEEEATVDFLEAVQLLPTACPSSMSDTDKQAHLQQRYGLGSSAAAACLNAGRSSSHALEVLEAGRRVVASLLLDMRSDLSDLRQKHPDLAEGFEMLGEMLNFKSNVGEDWRLPTEAEDSHPVRARQAARFVYTRSLMSWSKQFAIRLDFQNSSCRFLNGCGGQPQDQPWTNWE